MEYQVLYLFDPLCGWCYGFSDVIHAFAAQNQSRAEFVPIPGGMVTDDRRKPYNTMHAYISQAYHRVEEMTGCKFGQAYLEELLPSDLIMDSEPPSRAVITFRTFDLANSFAYIKLLQQGHYVDGKHLDDSGWFASLATQFGIDPVQFIQRYEEEKMKQHVQQEFAWVKESGVQGYPTVALRKGNQYYLLSNGYVNLQTLTENLEKALKSLSA